jgi:aminopeptidase N
VTIDTSPRDVLTRTEAEARAARVSDVRYHLDVDLHAQRTDYHATCRISFTASGSDDLFLDFRGRDIQRFEIGGTAVTPQRTPYRLALPGSRLGAGRTEVVIEYTNDYDRDGDGFHRFVDPEDGAEYVYSNFEPYDAHRLFPCFDQPDIKATYDVLVAAPAEWLVIANSRETAAEELPDGRLRHRFESTERFSTYLMALIAGPYHAEQTEHRGLPLSVLCRRSLAKHLEAEQLFEVTIQGMDFFAALFDRAYPFTKYDQIFVPEFNSGAMENVGAVTHSESFIFRDPPTESQRMTRAEVILHELAHMWFGNLTTMRWWNDIWLNESFATYVSYLALDEATRYRDAWTNFNSQMKRWAYRQDQLVTTHPIAGQVRDTDETFLNFDGITYGKGASVLKQLVKAIGREGFEAGIRGYFRRYAWANATLADFLRELEEGSGRSLTEWSRLWLETPSMNTIAARWETSDGTLTDLTLVQTAPPEYPTLRPHALEVALGRERDGHLEIDSLPAVIDGAEARVPGARGRPAPKLVYPNQGDHAFAKVALDPVTLAEVRSHLERIQEPLLRQLIWMSLWEMVRDRQLPSTDFLAIVREKIVLERDLELAAAVIQRAEIVLGYYVPWAERDAEAGRSFGAAWGALRAASAGDARIIWARAAIAAATTAELLKPLLSLADGRETIDGFELDQEMRWTIATKAVAFGVADGEARIAAERQRDPSDRGQRAVIRAEAGRPTEAAKAATWERILGEGYGSFHLTREAIRGFVWPQQRELVGPYAERYFELVRDVSAANDLQFGRAFAETLFPLVWGEPEHLERARGLIARLRDDETTLNRILRESADELARIITCRAYAAG